MSTPTASQMTLDAFTGSQSQSGVSSGRKRNRMAPSWDHFEENCSEDGTHSLTCRYCATDILKGRQSKWDKTAFLDRHLIFCDEVPLHEGILGHLIAKHGGTGKPTQLSKVLAVADRINVLKRRLNTGQHQPGQHHLGPLDQFIPRDHFDLQRQESVKAAIQSFVLKAGLPFAVVEEPTFLNLLRTLNAGVTATFMPSRRSIASESAVAAVHEDIMNEVFARIKEWPSTTLVVDGWTSVTQRTLLNVVVVNAMSGESYLLDSVDLSTKVKTTKTLLDSLHGYIDNPELKICGITSDSAANFKKLREDVMFQYGISSSPCLFHKIDLIAGRLLEHETTEKAVAQALQMVTWVKNHRYMHARAKEIAKNQSESFNVLVLPSMTRKASYAKVLRRLLKGRAIINMAFASDDVQERIRSLSGPKKVEAFAVRDLFMKDTNWETFKGLAVVMHQVESAQRVAERSWVSRSEMFWITTCLSRQWARQGRPGVRRDILQIAHETMTSKLKEFSSKFDLLSFFLDPRRSEKIVEDPVDVHDCWSDCHVMALQIARILRMRELYYTDVDEGDMQRRINLAMGHFQMAIEKKRKGKKNGPMMFSNDAHPLMWWILHGKRSFPLLTPIALRTLGVSPTASSVERVNSQMIYIHSKLRNRLSSDKARMLTQIYVNGRELEAQAEGATEKREKAPSSFVAIEEFYVGKDPTPSYSSLEGAAEDDDNDEVDEVESDNPCCTLMDDNCTKVLWESEPDEFSDSNS